MTGLEPGNRYEYEARLDGRVVWPEAGSPFPPSRIRTPGQGEAAKVVFGSCRISAPHEEPYTLGHTEDARGLGVDAMYAMAMRLKDEGPEELPDALVLLGDQIYAHKPPFDTLDFIRSRRDTNDAPGEAVADFEEYAHLYRDAWGDPAIRWLLSTVPSAMIFDDHEVGDDWNVSAAWVEEPSTVLVLSGDVHHGYLAAADFRDAKPVSRVFQAVCSPLRNALPGKKSLLQSAAWTRSAALAGRLLARLAGVEREELTWRLTHDEPFFDNQVATLDLDGPRAEITFEGAVLDVSGEPALEELYRHRLA